jgi:seryl-tRNA synthetase
MDMIDATGTKVSGSRFAYLKGDLVLLEFALVQFAMETLVKEGFTPIIPPVLIKKEITEGLGYWHAGGNEDYYLVSDFNVDEGKDEKENPLYLVGTAEHAIVPMHKDEVFQKKDLPKRYVGFSSAFRREAGTYGKDTKGILRVHQFDKVEMVSFVPEEDDEAEHEYLLSLEEKLFQALEIPYQVIKMCTGDLGFPVARKYDLEAWMPGQNKYREVTSVSTVTDFQSRRLNIKYLDGSDKKYVHILNGTAFAIGRTIIAIMENQQQIDGSILVPKVLQKYIGKEKISAAK